MKDSLPIALLVGGLLLASVTAEQPRAALPGWYGVFPHLSGYALTFQAPVVADGEKPTAYRQTARYEWTGGAARIVGVTLARDPAFKQKYAAEALRKQTPAPKEIQVGKRTGWLWHLAKDGGKFDQVGARLVVPLGDERALIMETRGPGPWGDEPVSLAAAFDLARVETALAHPPLPAGALRERVRALPRGAAYPHVLEWLGTPTQELPGGATHTLVYKQADGSQAVLRFDYDPNNAALPGRLREASHQRKDGQTEELVK